MPGVLLLPDSLYRITDENGRFQFDELANGSYELVATYVAHGSQRQTIVYEGKSLKLNFSLEYDTERLGEVIIEGEHDTLKKY